MAEFYNQAAVSYSGGTVLSNITVGRVQDTMTLAKTALRGTYAPGECVTFAVSLANTGETAVTGLTLTDDLGAYSFNGMTLVPLTPTPGALLVYVDGALQSQVAVTYADQLVITGLDLPAGGDLLVIYEAVVNRFAPLGNGGTITNTVTVAGGGIITLRATETITARQTAELRVTKTLAPTAVKPGEAVTYTFLVENLGATPVTTADAASLTDTFTPALTALTVSYNGGALVLNTDYSYAPATGEFATVPGRVTVPAAAYTQDAATGAWTAEPGEAVLTVTGTIL